MSGLCGWFWHDPGALPIEQMAAPLSRFDLAPLRLGAHGAGALGAAVAALLAGGAPVRTYSVGYEGEDDGMLARARALARQLGTVHEERAIGVAEVAEAIPRLAGGFDQPLGDPAVVVALYGATLARADGVQRLLGGHGAAELFGARLQYSQQARLSQYEKIPSALRQTLVEPGLFQLVGGLGAAPLRRARTYIEQAMAGLPGRLQAANLLHGYGSGAVFEAGFLAGVDPTAPAALLGQSWWQYDGASQVSQLIALDLQYALGDVQLPAMARPCQLSGLKAGFSYLADAVVAFAARLTPQHKLAGVRSSLFSVTPCARRCRARQPSIAPPRRCRSAGTCRRSRACAPWRMTACRT